MLQDGGGLGDPRNGDAVAGLPSKQEAGLLYCIRCSDFRSKKLKDESSTLHQAAESQWDMAAKASPGSSCVRFLTLLGMSASQAACKDAARVSRTCIRVFARPD